MSKGKASVNPCLLHLVGRAALTFAAIVCLLAVIAHVATDGYQATLTGAADTLRQRALASDLDDKVALLAVGEPVDLLFPIRVCRVIDRLNATTQGLKLRLDTGELVVGRRREDDSGAGGERDLPKGQGRQVVCPA